MNQTPRDIGNYLSLYGTFVKMLTLFMGFILATVTLISFQHAELLWRRIALWCLLTAFAMMIITLIRTHAGILKKLPPQDKSMCEPHNDEILTVAMGLMSDSIGFILIMAGLTLYEASIWIAFSVLFAPFSWRLIKASKKQTMEPDTPKKTPRSFVIVLILVIGVAGVFSGWMCGFNDGKKDVVSNIVSYENIMLNLSSPKTLSDIKHYFTSRLNYTELLVWESSRLNYTTRREVHTGPIEILNYGRGGCGELSILYVSICLANDIPARLVVPEPFIPGVIDHAWAEVNPSKDNQKWIHVEVTDSCVRIQQGGSIYGNPPTVDNPLLYRHREYPMVLAFQITDQREILIVDRTSVYRES